MNICLHIPWPTTPLGMLIVGPAMLAVAGLMHLAEKRWTK